MYFHERNPKLLIAGVLFFLASKIFYQASLSPYPGPLYIYIYMDKTLKHKKTIDDKIIVLRSSFHATLLK